MLDFIEVLVFFSPFLTPNVDVPRDRAALFSDRLDLGHRNRLLCSAEFTLDAPVRHKRSLYTFAFLLLFHTSQGFKKIKTQGSLV